MEFSIQFQSNNLIYDKGYNKRQQVIYSLILLLREEGLGYRKISRKLNQWGIKTHRGKKWFNTSVSSIVLDILYYKKIFIYPKYLAPNDFGEFENYNFYWNVGSEDELLDVLKKINKNPDFNKLNTSDSDRFYNKMVYVGSKRNSLSDFNELYRVIAINNKDYVA